jgi:hypothetical protein
MGKKLTRRRFMKAMINGVAVSVALPYFDCLLDGNGLALAQGTALPKRFGTFFWGLGYGLDINHWNPMGSGAGTAWQIPENHGLSALKSYKDYLTVFSNYSHLTPLGAGHIPQRGISVSASHNPNWVIDSGASGFRHQNMPLPSIDAIVQQNWQNSLGTPHSFINASMKLGSLYLGTSSWNTGGGARLFHRTPTAVYNAVFKDLQQGPLPPSQEQDLAKLTYNFKKSILDSTMDQASSLKLSLGAKDKIRLDAHLEGIRNLERKLTSINDSMNVPTCSGVTAPNDFPSASDISKRNQVFSQLMVYALSCNLTRIFCYEFSPTQCNAVIPEIGLTAAQGLHDGYSHGNTAGMRTYLSFVMKNLAYFVDLLRNTPEGAGNLLDNMLMLGTGEYAGPHHHNGHPYIYIGKAGGGLKGNYHSRMSSTNNNEASRILLTAAHALGINLPSLGMGSTKIIGTTGDTHSYRATAPINDVLG